MSPPDVPMSSGVNMSASFAVMSEDEDQCPRCGMFYADDEFSSGTETDDGETDNEVTTLYGNLSEDSAKLGNELYEAYLVAKRRWRRFSNKPPRRVSPKSFQQVQTQIQHAKDATVWNKLCIFLATWCFCCAHEDLEEKLLARAAMVDRIRVAVTVSR